MANIVCKDWFLFQVENMEKLLLKHVVNVPKEFSIPFLQITLVQILLRYELVFHQIQNVSQFPTVPQLAISLADVSNLKRKRKRHFNILDISE